MCVYEYDERNNWEAKLRWNDSIYYIQVKKNYTYVKVQEILSLDWVWFEALIIDLFVNCLWCLGKSLIEGLINGQEFYEAIILWVRFLKRWQGILYE